MVPDVLTEVLRRIQLHWLPIIWLKKVVGFMLDYATFQAGLVGRACPRLRHGAARSRIRLGRRGILGVALGA